jgi:perosamine synthetase
MEKLAIFGGPKTLDNLQKDAFAWPMFDDQEKNAVVRVMTMADYRFYEEAYALENEIKDFYNTGYALAHTNGTAAIHSALYAIGVGPGDEVIVPALTYWASAMPVLSCNAVPVFIESDPRTLNLDPDDFERKITHATKAIVVVHLNGLPCDMDSIMKIAKSKNIKVIEDCAHVHDAEYKGRKLGTIGDIGCFSYQATKLLPGIEGGMFITDNEKYYEKAVVLGHYERLSGLSEDSVYRKYQHTCMGYKYRIHPLSAAILRVQLKKYDGLNKLRNENIAYLDEKLNEIKGLDIIKTPDYIKRNYYCYRLKYRSGDLDGLPRDNFIAAAQAEGLEIGKERYVLLHQQPVFNEVNQHFPWVRKEKILPAPVNLPVTEELHKELLSLPTFPQASRSLIDKYVEGIKKVIRNLDALKELDISHTQEKPDMDWKKMQMPKTR